MLRFKQNPDRGVNGIPPFPTARALSAFPV